MLKSHFNILWWFKWQTILFRILFSFFSKWLYKILTFSLGYFELLNVLLRWQNEGKEKEKKKQNWLLNLWLRLWAINILSRINHVQNLKFENMGKQRCYENTKSRSFFFDIFFFFSPFFHFILNGNMYCYFAWHFILSLLGARSLSIFGLFIPRNAMYSIGHIKYGIGQHRGYSNTHGIWILLIYLTSLLFYHLFCKYWCSDTYNIFYVNISQIRQNK